MHTTHNASQPTKVNPNGKKQQRSNPFCGYIHFEHVYDEHALRRTHFSLVFLYISRIFLIVPEFSI